MRAHLFGGALVLEGEPLLARWLLEPTDALVGRAIEVKRFTSEGGGNVRLRVIRPQSHERGAVRRQERIFRNFLLRPASCQSDQRESDGGGSAKRATKGDAILHVVQSIGKI